MKTISDKLQKEGLLFKKLKPMDIKIFKSRKKIDIYLGVDLQKYYACVIHIKKKSRILSKEVINIMEFHQKLEKLNESRIKKKYIYIQAPLCSKAKSLLKAEKWTIWTD